MASESGKITFLDPAASSFFYCRGFLFLKLKDNYYLFMNLRSVLSLILLISVFAAGCRKEQATQNPCEGLLNESPPTVIILKFVEKATGQNLILSKNLQNSDLSITNSTTKQTFANWSISNNPTSTAPLNGTLQLSIFNENPGEYQYKVKIKDLAAITLAYKVTKTATDNPCKPYSYPVGEIKITDQAFAQFVHEGKTYPNILVLEL